MKPSHTQTPRMLEDASFIPSADPVQRMTAEDRYYAPVYVAVVLAAVFCAYAIVVWG